MATQETQQLDSIIASRRALLMGGVTLGAMALTSGVAHAAIPAMPGDVDILNFALNLEYLEAQFYTLATEGVYAESSASTPIIGINAGTATGGKNTTTTLITKPNTSTSSTKVIAPVPFTSPSIAAYAFETALEERKHVNFLRNALGASAAAQPVLDLYNSFNTLGQALTPALASFDPFANDAFFLAGAYIFEDVGVSAYHGGAPLLSATNLVPAAKIHAVEAYHAGLIRSTMSGFDNGYIAIPGFTAAMLQLATGYTSFAQLTQAISAVRATVDGTQGTAAVDDNGLGLKQVALNTSNATFMSTSILNGDSNYLGRSRTPRQVLNVVYATAGAPTKGGFYPNGLSGTIN